MPKSHNIDQYGCYVGELVRPAPEKIDLPPFEPRETTVLTPRTRSFIRTERNRHRAELKELLTWLEAHDRTHGRYADIEATAAKLASRIAYLSKRLGAIETATKTLEDHLQLIDRLLKLDDNEPLPIELTQRARRELEGAV